MEAMRPAYAALRQYHRLIPDNRSASTTDKYSTSVLVGRTVRLSTRGAVFRGAVIAASAMAASVFISFGISITPGVTLAMCLHGFATLNT
jgi:hypothetical protein